MRRPLRFALGSCAVLFALAGVVVAVRAMTYRSPASAIDHAWGSETGRRALAAALLDTAHAPATCADLLRFSGRHDLRLLAAEALARYVPGVDAPGHPVIAAEHALLEATVRHEGRALGRLLADGMSITRPSGRTLAKPELIARWSAVDPRVTSASSTLEEARVHAFGAAAVVQARVVDAFREDGIAKEIVTDVMDAWVQTGGAWRLVAAREVFEPENAVAGASPPARATRDRSSG